MNPISVCTLFEGDYHLGLAALANSLVHSGFSGTIYAGYRGKLPLWTIPHRTHDPEGELSGCRFTVSDQVEIVFVRIGTDHHFTNYKPKFMRTLLSGPASDTAAVLYLDPDIVVSREWSFFRDWLSCGIALCEDINSTLHQNHPVRVGWRRTFSLPLGFKDSVYVNGGCIGIRREDLAFLDVWENVQSEMFSVTGGADVVGIGATASAHTRTGFAGCLQKTDQDALNAAIEASPDATFSILGKEAMGFQPGLASLPHAIGPWKPWNRSYLAKAIFEGRPPRRVDKEFWRSIDGPIAPFHTLHVALKRLALMISAGIGRFYRRF